MSTRLFSCRSLHFFLAALLASLILLTSATPGRTSAADRGSIGIFFAQLYDPQMQPGHLGPLVVLKVVEGSPAEKAGIHSGDLVIAVNGTPVGGREIGDVLNEIHGPIGGTIRLYRFKGPMAANRRSHSFGCPTHRFQIRRPIHSCIRLPGVGQPIHVIIFRCHGRRRFLTTAS